MLLIVPVGFDDVDAAVRRERTPRALENRHDLLLAETIQKLAHPDGVLIARKFERGVQEVDRVIARARAVTLCSDDLTSHVELSWKIEQTDRHLRIMLETGEREFARVGADIQQ